jgi:hypothetical protein
MGKTGGCRVGVAICLFMLSLIAGQSARATPVTYRLDDASFSFLPFGSSVTATVDLTGTFVLDPVAQIFTDVNVTLSGLPPAYALLNDTFNTILFSFFSSQQFDAVNAPNDDELVLHFLDTFDTIGPNPLLSVGLTCQTCPGNGTGSLSVTGSADPIPEPGSLGLVMTAVLAWIALVIRRRTEFSAKAATPRSCLSKTAGARLVLNTSR